MAYYLVDFENVNSDGLTGIETLGPSDIVVIFYTKNAASLSIDAHLKLNSAKADLDGIIVESGKKNALDFQLVSYLGFVASRNPDTVYYIVTKDKGFQSVVPFMGRLGVRCEVVANLQKTTMEQEDNEIRETLAKAGVLSNPKDLDLVLAYVERYKTKLGLNNALQKQFNSQKGGEIYKLLKPYIQDKKGN